jgi:endonuclease/exonuclease/phosphatase (EEP) superfamily protein YafD
MRRALWIGVIAVAVWAIHERAGGSVTCAAPEFLTRAYSGPPASRLSDQLTIVSINLAKETDADKIAAELLRQKTLEGADVLSLQEVTREAAGPNVAERLALRLGMTSIVAGSGPPGSGESTDAVALLSRLPMRDPVVIQLPQNGLGVRSRCRMALAATVDDGKQAVRVIGVHLDTRVNAEARRKQLEPALESVTRFKGPVILAGDLNTNSFWWFEHLAPIPFLNDQPQAIYDYMISLGFRSPFTPGKQTTNDFLWLQLDWVFLRGLESAEWGVAPVDFSDHHVVWVKTKTHGS